MFLGFRFVEHGIIIEEFLMEELPELYYDDWEISQVLEKF